MNFHGFQSWIDPWNQMLIEVKLKTKKFVLVDKEPLSTNNSILIKLTCEFVEVYKNLCQQLLVLIKSQYMYITRNIYHYQYIETIQAWNSVLNYSNILIKILLFCCLGLTVLMSGQIDVYLVMAILKLLCTKHTSVLENMVFYHSKFYCHTSFGNSFEDHFILRLCQTQPNFGVNI